MMSLWDALRMNMMNSYQELVRTFPYAHKSYFQRGIVNNLIFPSARLSHPLYIVQVV